MTDARARKKYHIDNDEQAKTEDVAACLASVFESVRAKGEIWYISLNADQGVGKSTFCRAFVRAVFASDKHANALGDVKDKTDSVLSLATQRQVRIGDSRTQPEYSEERIPGFGGYDMYENYISRYGAANIDMFRWNGARWMEISLPAEVATLPAMQSALSVLGARELNLD